MAVVKIDFEGLAASHDFLVMPHQYAGLHWSRHQGALDRGYADDHYPQPDGFHGAIHGDGVGYTSDLGGFSTSSFFSHHEFSLKAGIFAAAFNEEQRVVFTAFRNGEQVGHKEVVLGLDGQTVRFGAGFHHIDEVVMSTNPDDGGSGGELAFDNLRIDESPSALHHADAVFSHDMSRAHEVAFHPMDTWAHMGLDALC